MSKYVIFFSLSDDSIKTFMQHPTDRRAAVAKVVEQLGGQVDGYYWMLGPYDGFVIAELPDSKASAAVAMVTMSSGALRRIETYEIFESDELAGIAQQARTAAGAYQGPNQAT